MLEIEKHSFDDDTNERESIEEDQIEDLDFPINRKSQLQPLSLQDGGVYYEYGPKMQENRYKY